VEKEKETALTVGAHGGGGGGGALQEHDAALQGEEDPQEARRRRSPPAAAHVEVEPSAAAAAAALSSPTPPPSLIVGPRERACRERTGLIEFTEPWVGGRARARAAGRRPGCAPPLPLSTGTWGCGVKWERGEWSWLGSGSSWSKGRRRRRRRRRESRRGEASKGREGKQQAGAAGARAEQQRMSRRVEAWREGEDLSRGGRRREEFNGGVLVGGGRWRTSYCAHSLPLV
jgi:hypothetical protein